MKSEALTERTLLAVKELVLRVIGGRSAGTSEYKKPHAKQSHIPRPRTVGHSLAFSPMRS